MVHLIQYRVRMGSRSGPGPNNYGVMVMGSSKVGKTSFIKQFLRLDDDVSEPTNKIDSLYEYREYKINSDTLIRSTEPPLRSRAIETGKLFVLLFSVIDVESFNFAIELRDAIVEKKDNDVPILFVGLTPEHKPRITRSISFEFADLVVSCDFENKYYEVCISDDLEMKKLHAAIVDHQQAYYTRTAEHSKKRSIDIRRVFQRLFSFE